MQTFHIPISARALVRASLEVQANSEEEARAKVQRQLDIGEEPGVQLVSDATWRYDFIEDGEEIKIRE